MAAYLIAGNDVTDPKIMEKYVEVAGPTLEPCGARLLAPSMTNIVMGGPVAHKEGPWKPSRVVIIEFPSMDKALAWYNSPAYQSAMKLRLKGSVGSLLFADGA